MLFQQLAALNVKGTFKIVATPVGGGKLAVSVLLDDPTCGDDARLCISPITVTGTPQELDEGLVAYITKPIQAAAGLMGDLEANMRSIDEAKKQKATAAAATSKPATTPATPAAKTSGALPGAPATSAPAPAPVVDKKQKAYTDAMAKVKTLADARKYLDAIKALPAVKDYADKAEIINKRKAWLVQMSVDGGGVFPAPYPVDPAEAMATIAQAIETAPNVAAQADAPTTTVEPDLMGDSGEEADDLGEGDGEGDEDPADLSDDDAARAELDEQLNE